MPTTTTPALDLLGRARFPLPGLEEAHPPLIRNPNKEAVLRRCRSVRGRASEALEVTRWRAGALPAAFPGAARGRVRAEAGFFTYDPAADPGHVAWHLNFADAHLFVAYGSGLFAQDEMQVAEHPALASLLEALRETPFPGLEPATRGERRVPTPVLVRGAERRCAIDTRDLYGNRFARASVAAVEAATRPLDPPTVSNIIAVEAPKYGRGRYSRADIEDVLATAYTGFAAAREESGGAPVAIHTGHWGTGAYGGNRVIMAILQLAAAALAGVEVLVYHTGDPAGAAPVREAEAIVARLVAPSGSVARFVADVEALGLLWGVSDGN